MLFQDLAAEGFDLALEYNLEARPLQAEVQAPDSTEERRDFVCQGVTPRYRTFPEPLDFLPDSVK